MAIHKAQTSNKSKKTCPICTSRYGMINLAEAVCAIHQNWLVITCERCGEVRFSDSIGLCMVCARDVSAGYGHFAPQGSTNKRAILAHYGLEKFEG